ncbi:MAG: hypothetical protein ACRED9_05520 [Caulobacteraceae bacterium]
MKVSLILAPVGFGVLLAGAAIASGWPPPLAPAAPATHHPAKFRSKPRAGPIHPVLRRRAACPPARHAMIRHRLAPRRHSERAFQHRWLGHRGTRCDCDHGVSSSAAFIYHQELALHGFTPWQTRGRDYWGAPPWLDHRDIGPGAPLPAFATLRPPRRIAPPPPLMSLPPNAQGGERFAWRGSAEGAMAEQGRREVRIWRSQGEQGGPEMVWRGPGAPPWARREDDRRAGRWRLNRGGGYEVWHTTGRDDQGYLIWPGKPRTDRSPGW